MTEPLAVDAPQDRRAAHYEDVLAVVRSLLETEDDWISAMSTVACELHHGFAYFDWTGFYRVVAPQLLAVGPYQGGHGCLRIPFDRGVCGAAARTLTTQLVEDVNGVADHIACSATTRSEIVVPVVTAGDRLLAVLDVDSDTPSAFTDVDRQQLESLCHALGRQFGSARG